MSREACLLVATSIQLMVLRYLVLGLLLHLDVYLPTQNQVLLHKLDNVFCNCMNVQFEQILQKAVLLQPVCSQIVFTCLYTSYNMSFSPKEQTRVANPSINYGSNLGVFAKHFPMFPELSSLKLDHHLFHDTR